MTDADPVQPQTGQETLPGLGRRVILARLGLLWETFWRAVWMPASALALFVAASLFDVWRFIPASAHALILLSVILSFAVSLHRHRRAFRWMERRAILARIEAENRLAHHPLLSLQDRLELGAHTADAQTLWRAHLARVRRALPALRFVMPRPQAIRLDRLGLRHVAGIALAAGLLAAGSHGLQRVKSGFMPVGLKAAAPDSRLEAWITPPAYTAVAPIMIAGRELEILPQAAPAPGAPIKTPIGSELSLRLFGDTRAELRLIPENGKKTQTTLTRIDSANSHAVIKLERSQQVVLHQSGAKDRAWRIEIIPDQPPLISLLQEITLSKQYALQIKFGATDDYGVRAVKAEFSLASNASAPPYRVDLPVPPRDGKNAGQMAYVDLTAHPWAGLPVRLKLNATDTAGQTGTSPSIDLILPQRPFSHPLARAIIEQRRIIASNPDQDKKVARALDALSLYPDQFTQELPVYLALRVARHRLDHATGNADARTQVTDLLWALALRLEDGHLSMAGNELRQLQQALMQALRNGASEEEISQLTQALREALKNFLQAMQEQAEADALKGEATPGADSRDGQKTLKQSDLESLLEQIEKLGKTGARQAAQDMLSKLQNMLENLRAARPGAEENSRQQLYGDALRDLSAMLRQQQKLRDETYQQGQGDAPGENLAQDQEALRGQLGDLMQQLGEGEGEIPNALGRAERAMRSAEGALREGQSGDALVSQGQSLDQLRAGLDAMAKTLREEDAKAEAENGPSGEAGMPGGEKDPLGRPLGHDPGGRAAIPEQFDIERALQIRRELEQRASQRRRPAEELNYIDRLLKLF